MAISGPNSTLVRKVGRYLAIAFFVRGFEPGFSRGPFFCNSGGTPTWGPNWGFFGPGRPVLALGGLFLASGGSNWANWGPIIEKIDEIDPPAVSGSNERDQGVPRAKRVKTAAYH